MGKKTGLPDADYGGDLRFATFDWVDNPHWDVDEVHDVFRRWRAVANTYDGDRIFVAEAVVRSAERLSNYLRPDEMHSAFNFPYMKSAWDAGALRAVIDATLARSAPCRCAGHLGDHEPRRGPAGHPVRPDDHSPPTSPTGRARSRTSHSAPGGHAPPPC